MAGFLEKNITAAAAVLEDVLAAEHWASARGLLQRIDARVKIVCALLVILACSLTARLPVLASLYLGATILAVLSGIGPAEFTRRVWLFIPLFSGLIAIPALFLTPGDEIGSLGGLIVTRQGVRTALLLVLRVSTSVSFTLLVVLTTTWNGIMDALTAIKLPAIFVSLLSITYRYLLLLVRTVIELFLARRSRIIGAVRHDRQLGFMSRSIGYLFMKTLHLAEGIQMAMTSRGFTPGAVPVAGDAAGEDAGGPVRAGHIFELRGIGYVYPDGVAGVSVNELDIPAGTCDIIMGPNGSGKSTLLKILDGLIFPQTGEVRAFGETITEARLGGAHLQKKFRSRVGLVFQDPDIQCFSPTVRQELAFGPRQKGLQDIEVERKVHEIMALLGLEEIADRYPYRLSGGEKKRVAIASVLTVDPDVYLMDEPTANLDPATEGTLIDVLVGLRLSGKTLVIATQDILLARHIGDRAVLLGPGKNFLKAGPIESVLADRELLERSGLAHAHRSPHHTALAADGHTHYTEDREK